MMLRTIQFGSKEISFQLSYADRKSLGITVTPSMEVLVKAPAGTSIEKIEEKVKKRAGWILRQQSYFLSFEPRTPERKYISGESHLYLGRQYRLQVTSGNKNSVHHRGRFIEIIAKDKLKAGEILNEWYRQKAKDKFAEFAEPLIANFTKYNIEPKGLFIQEMPTRWGSCTPKGKIILNPELIKAPRRCIEYVIIHELCHLIHLDHTAKFFELQQKQMPDWEKWKNKLEYLLA